MSTDEAAERRKRIPSTVRASRPLGIALGMWHVGVMAMDTLELEVVEAVRLTAGRHHDCLT